MRTAQGGYTIVQYTHTKRTDSSAHTTFLTENRSLAFQPIPLHRFTTQHSTSLEAYWRFSADSESSNLQKF